MLVLTRRTNEAITVGEDVEITIVEVRAGQVRLGITAPLDVSVHRKEIWEQRQAENAASTISSTVKINSPTP